MQDLTCSDESVIEESILKNKEKRVFFKTLVAFFIIVKRKANSI